MKCDSARRALGLGMVLALLLTAGVAAEKDMIKLPLKLPKPAFSGTPKDIPPDCGNVEPPSNKPRPIPMVPAGTVNLAYHKKVTTGGGVTFSGSLDLVVDGDKEAYEGSAVELKAKRQYIQLDLGAASPLYYIVVWHYHMEPCIYHDVIVQVSNDPDFQSGVTTLFNNDQDNSSGLGTGQDKEYWETYEGKLIAAKAHKARYVRLYSRGSTYSDPLNRYTEVEVWGLPAK